MASASTILAQAVPALQNAFPGWRAPVHLRLVASIGASGAPTAVAAKTTPGLEIVRDTNGTYTLSFPQCRDIDDVNIQLWMDDPTDVDGADHGRVDHDNTTATGGELVFTTNASDDGTVLDPASGDELHVTFWADLG